MLNDIWIKRLKIVVFVQLLWTFELERTFFWNSSIETTRQLHCFLCDPLLCYTFSIFQNWWNYKFVNLNFYQTLRNELGRFPFLEKSVVAVPLRFGVHFQVGRAAIPTFARNRPVKFLLRQKWSKWAIARTTTAPKRLAPPAVQRHSKPLPTIVTLILKVWKLKNKFWKL